MQGFIAVAGSIIILVWPVLVMITRSVIESTRSQQPGAARAWRSDWFAGPGILITGGWVVGVFGLRIATDALLSDQDQVGVVSWIIVGAAMLVMIPIAARRPKARET